MDVLSILQHGVSGPDVAAQAKSVLNRFFSISPGYRNKAILDPRVVASLESIQRLVAELGNSALSRHEWTELTGFILRLEVFCLLVSGETGSIKLTSNGESWLSIPGTGFYLPPDGFTKVIQLNRGKLTNTDVVDARIANAIEKGTNITLAMPEKALMPPIEGSACCT